MPVDEFREKGRWMGSGWRQPLGETIRAEIIKWRADLVEQPLNLLIYQVFKTRCHLFASVFGSSSSLRANILVLGWPKFKHTFMSCRMGRYFDPSRYIFNPPGML